MDNTQVKKKEVKLKPNDCAKLRKLILKIETKMNGKNIYII